MIGPTWFIPPIPNLSKSDNTETYQPGIRCALTNYLMQNVFVCQTNKGSQLQWHLNDCSSYIYGHLEALKPGHLQHSFYHFMPIQAGQSRLKKTNP